MLDWVSGKTVRTQSYNSQPIISSPFVLTADNKDYENVIASLYQDFVILENKKNNSKIRIVFQRSLLFQVVRFKEQGGALGTPRAIKFQFQQKWLQLKNSSITKELELWVKKLSSKLSQRGFHDNYQALRKIGKGGFASVFLVRRRHNSQQIAVKAFSKDGVQTSSKGLLSLEKEIKIMRSLEHPNLMKLHEVFETQNSYYLCVQLLSGGSLLDRIRKKGRLTPSSIKNIIKSILEGLQYMHSRNIMHRDLKPDNILFRDADSDQCVIGDFGLGQQSEAEQFIFNRCGTPGYVAPQVVNFKTTNQKYTVACDMFSLGVVFHILALKKSPFQGKSYNKILMQNRNCLIDFKESQYQKIPQTWLDLLKKLLERDPKKRITASQALQHRFFSQDDIFKQYFQQRRYQSRQKPFGSLDKTNQLNSCESNLLLSTNKERKNNINLREDSCLKFKMKENIMTGIIKQNSKNLQPPESPLTAKSNLRTPVQSRFKIRA